MHDELQAASIQTRSIGLRAHLFECADCLGHVGHGRTPNGAKIEDPGSALHECAILYQCPSASCSHRCNVPLVTPQRSSPAGLPAEYYSLARRGVAPRACEYAGLPHALRGLQWPSARWGIGLVQSGSTGGRSKNTRAGAGSISPPNGVPGVERTRSLRLNTGKSRGRLSDRRCRRSGNPSTG